MAALRVGTVVGPEAERAAWVGCAAVEPGVLHVAVPHNPGIWGVPGRKVGVDVRVVAAELRVDDKAEQAAFGAVVAAFDDEVGRARPRDLR